jgi:transcriptional regulator with XRE-family HTH domain
MPDSFGARLRQRREERQIALTSIADDTKIKLTLLEALERDDVSHWPSGIFRRAYIKAYAHMIGLDPDEVLREFLELHPEPAEVAAAAALAAAEEAARKAGPPPTRLRNIVDSALGSLVRLRRTAGAEDSSPPAPSQVAAAEPAPNRLVVSESAGGFSSSDMTDDDTVPGIRLEDLQPPRGTVPVAEGTVPLAGGTVPLSEPVAEPPPLGRTDDTVPEALPASLPVLNGWGPDAPAALEAVAAAPRAEPTQPVNANPVPPPSSPATGSDLEAVAGLCTAFARVVDRNEVQRLLHEAARILDAIGLIVWVWDATAEALMPALVYGYSDKVLAQLPTVRRDGDNVTAAAFRTGQTCELPGTTHTSGALVVPLLTPDGCAGVLALELQPGVEETRAIRAAATILAAVVTQLVLRIRIAETRAQSLKSPLRVRGERGSRISGSQIGGV